MSKLYSVRYRVLCYILIIIVFMAALVHIIVFAPPSIATTHGFPDSSPCQWGQTKVIKRLGMRHARKDDYRFQKPSGTAVPLNTKHDYQTYDLKPNFPVWMNSGFTKLNGSTTKISARSQLIKPLRAVSLNHHRYYQIGIDFKPIGWVSAQALRRPLVYQIPFHYYSQLMPVHNTDACEISAVRMALSAVGHDPRISMRRYIQNVPRSKDPSVGYTHNPFVLGDGADLDGTGMLRYGEHYNAKKLNAGNLSMRQIISDIKHGYPVVAEEPYKLLDIPNSNHDLVLIGYMHGEIECADPYYEPKTKTAHLKPLGWCSTRVFWIFSNWHYHHNDVAFRH